MYAMKSRQRGGGVVSWIFYLLVIGLVWSFAIKVVPFYMDDYSVGQVMSSLADRQGVSSASVSQIRTWIDRGLQLNMVYLNPGEVNVSNKTGIVTVDVNYERRIHFVHNVDLVLMFEHHWKPGMR